MPGTFLPPVRTLMGPGPSDVSPRVLEALARPTVGHLDPAFVGLMEEVKTLLGATFLSESAFTMPVSGPGTAGMETCVVNLVEPGTLYGERVNQVDMRFAKVLRFGRTRTTVGFDVYNIANSNAVLTYNQTFSPVTTTWLRPNSVLQPRFVKLSAQIDF